MGSIVRYFRFFLIGTLVATLLGACVTTEERQFSVETTDEKAVKTYVDLALRYMAEGLMEEAKRPLRLAREINEDSPLVYAATAYLMQTQGDLEFAEQNYIRALDLDPKFQSARNNYGAFLYQQKKYQRAQDLFEIVAADPLYPKRFFVYENLGFCAIGLGQFESAETYFKKALALNGNLFRSALELAELNYRKKDYAAAQTYIKRYSGIGMLAKIPDSAKSLWLKLRVARATGDSIGQMTNVRSLSAEFPESAEYQLYLKSLGGKSAKSTH